jgi:protease-4
VIARGNSITGSVGVIMQWAEFSKLLQNLGVKVEEVRSGPLKATPSPFASPDPASRALVEDIVAESRDWFVGIVAQRRNLSPADVEQIRSGRIYTGRQAIKIGLVDELGDEANALKWLKEKRGIPDGLEVIDRKVEKTYDSFLMKSLGAGAKVILGSTFDQFATIFADDRRLNHLDGLVSVWHPQQ